MSKYKFWILDFFNLQLIIIHILSKTLQMFSPSYISQIYLFVINRGKYCFYTLTLAL